MGSRAFAIVWAQWRTLLNYLPRSNKAGLSLGILLGIIWYSGFVVLAAGAAVLLSDGNELPAIARILPGALLLAFLYWQVIPLLLVSTGSALEIKKLAAYPIPSRELFGLEALLRVTTGIEVLIVFAGAGLGLLLNPRIPIWAPLGLIVFAAFNLFISVGVRDLLARLFARKGIRELLIFLFVIAAALPQLILVTGVGPAHRLKGLAALPSLDLWPWIAAAGLAQGRLTASNCLALAGWTFAAYFFARWQFDRSLRFDVQEASASDTARPRTAGLLDRLFRLPGAFFADPLGALIEKELRFLSRSARFRLVFLMGFSFGLLIWLPVTFGKAGSPDSWMAHNYLVMVSLYALLLLSDVLFWNVFGFDRSAAQVYFLVPVTLRTVLRAKNLAAMAYVLLELTVVVSVCAILRFPIHAGKLAEAYAVTLTVALFLMAIGNLSSTHNPKAVDPAKSFRNSAGRQTQALLMFFFPVSLAPVALAYAARYAFRSQLAFGAVLLFVAGFGAVIYHIATDSAIATAESRKEEIITALSGTEGPIAG